MFYLNDIKILNEDEAEDFDEIEGIKRINFLETNISNNHKKVVKFPLTSDEVNMKNKKCDYKTMAIMTLYSKANIVSNEKHRYLYKEDIMLNKEEIEHLSNNKINTICKNIKKLCQLESKVVEAKNTKNGIVYMINYATECKEENGISYRKFVLIEEQILRYLMDTATSNLIKTYIYLKYRCEQDETKITAKEIASNIGLSIKSKNNLQVIYNILKSLEGSNLIETKKIYNADTTASGKEVVRKYIYCKIKEYDEWIKWYNDKK